MNPGKARGILARMMVWREVKLEQEPQNGRLKAEWEVLAHTLGLLNAMSPPDPQRAALSNAENECERQKLRRQFSSGPKEQREPREARCTCERCPVHSKKEAAE
jgi:hypothetical protein